MSGGRYELVVFDWDGTLMDSADKIVNCFRSAAGDAGLPVPAREAVRRIIGLGLAEALAELFPGAGDAALQRAGGAYRHYFLEGDRTAMRLFPGVVEGLGHLKSQRLALGVATGKARRGLDRLLADTRTGHLFDATRCVDEACSKPHPRMLWDILEHTGTDPSRALMVGDTTFDMQMAAAAGMDALAVDYGAHPPAALHAEAPKACLSSFSEVVQWIRQS